MNTSLLQELHWLPVHQRVEFKLACLVHQSLAEQTPSYLAYSIQLTANTGRPQLRSANEKICVVPRTHTQQLRREKFFCCRSWCVERLVIISAAGHELQPIQACTERTYRLGYGRPRRTVTNLLSCTLEAYLLTYLLTIDMSRKERATVPLSGGGELSPHLT